MKSLLPAAFLSLASALLYSAPVSVTCGAPLTSSVTSESSLSAACTSLSNGSSYSGGGATASASVVLQLAANGAGFNSLLTSQSAYAQQAPRQSQDDLFGPGAETSIALTYTATLSTGGSVRSGFLQIEGFGNGVSFYDGGASMTSGIVPASGSAFQTEITCYSNYSYCTPGTTYYMSNSLIPVMLGTAFTLEANGGTSNWASGFDGSSGGSLDTRYNFRFLEADGVTGVAVSQAPEPLTVGLVGLAFGALGLSRKMRSRR